MTETGNWPSLLPKVAVITGASRGLGAGIAARLAEYGIALGLCARTTPLEPGSVPSVCAPVDVTDADAVEAFAAEVTERLGPIGLWVNNAGVLDPIGPIRNAPTDELTTHFDVNVLGVVWGSRTFARLVHNRQKPGLLINISSGAAQSASEGWGAYCAAKAGVDQLSRVLQLEEAAFGLRVVSLAPGVVDTDMQAQIRSTPASKFPSVERFRNLKASETFNSPTWIADRLIELADPADMPSWARSQSDAVVLRVPDQNSLS